MKLELNKWYQFTAYITHSQQNETITFRAQVLELAGSGVFGYVYKLQTDIPNNRILAVKITLQDHNYRNRELMLLKQFQHENILNLKYYFEKQSKYDQRDTVLYMFTDYYPLDLLQLIRQTNHQNSTIPTIYVRLMIYQIIKGAAYFHSYNCCHRDLKPENIFYDTQTLKLVIGDFGSAKKVSSDQQNISYICSRFFRAPELVLGQCKYGVEPDIWSIGCNTLFQGADNKEMFLLMINVLGTPTQQDFEDMGLGELNAQYRPVRPCNLQQMIQDEATKQFLLRMLTFSPIKRATAEQLLTDKFFLPLYQCKSLVNNEQKFPYLKQIIKIKDSDNEYLDEKTISQLISMQNINIK